MNIEPNPGSAASPSPLPAGDSSTTSAQFAGPRGSTVKRALRVLREEFAGLHLRLSFTNLLVALLPHHAFPRLRAALYRLGGVTIGKSTLILGRLHFGGQGRISGRLRIGSHCVVNAPLYLDLTGEIVIGDHVHVGHHTVLVTADHEVGSPWRRGGAIISRAIHIEDGCLIGARVTILGGVQVARHSIVTPGSVVAASVPASKLVGGVPSRTIKSLPDSP